MTLLAWALGVLLLLAAVNYVAFVFGIDIAGLEEPEEGHADDYFTRSR